MTHAHNESSVFYYTPPASSVDPLPVVIACPHSSCFLPDDFNSACSTKELNQSVDLFVDTLVQNAPQYGIGVFKAAFSRIYIDPNRSTLDIDTKILDRPWKGKSKPTDRSRFGKGLIHRTSKSGNHIYASPLSPEQVQKRIDHYYTPYHEALQEKIDVLHDTYGESLLLDMHSMWPVARTSGGNRKRPDFIIGDRDGQSCDRTYRHLVAENLITMGYHVTINDMFKGAEILKRYGRPYKNQHALQIEINKNLYLNTDSLEKSNGFDGLQNSLEQLIKNVQHFFRQKSS